MSIASVRQNEAMPKQVRYLSTSEFAERIGVKPDTLNRYALPEPDAVIGNIRGWKPATIDAWNAARPGRGRWATSRKPARKIAPRATRASAE